MQKQLICIIARSSKAVCFSVLLSITYDVVNCCHVKEEQRKCGFEGPSQTTRQPF